MVLSDFPLEIILLIAMTSRSCDAYNLLLAYGWSKKEICKELKKRKDVFLYDGKKKVPKDVTIVISYGFKNVYYISSTYKSLE